MVKICKVCNHRHFNDGDFCSAKCELSSIKPDDRQNKKSVRIIPCIQCGKEFLRSNKKQVFCSRECVRENRKGHESEIHNVETKCPECGKEYIAEISGYYKGVSGRFCDACQEKLGRKTTRLYTRTNTNEEHPDLVMSQTEIAEKIGITKQAVSLYEIRALRKFKKNFEKMYPDTVGLIRLDSERYGKLKNSMRVVL